jgi:tetratricopeptide (TPR) repeat protein
MIRTIGVVALAGALVAGCTRGDTDVARPAATTSSRSGVPALPDVSTLAPEIQQQIRTDYAAMVAVEKDSSRAASDRGEAYGSMGRRLLAVDYPEAAQPFLEKAQALMPSDMRWPYYLGHAYRRGQDRARAAVAFEQALGLKPDDVPSLVWLGETYLALGRAADAEVTLSKAVALDPRSVAAWFQRGRAAEAMGQHQKAIEYLTTALKIDPKADAVHYQLGLAYRSIRNLEQAEAHLRYRADAESVTPVDPLMTALPALSESSASYVVRGVEAMERRDWKTAIANLRTASRLAPTDGTIQLNLGTSLYLAGDRDGARQAFAAAIRLAPRLPKAQYTFGLLEEDDGHDGPAIARFTAAITADPNYAEAHASLADALRRTGRVEEALAHYATVLAIDPGAAQARFGYAMGLVRLGRWREARDWLAESVKTYPGQPGFPHALARVLAAAPDDAVRNGREALRIAQQLLQSQRSPALLETTAMAQAELGRYDEAIATERQAMTLARTAGQSALTDRMRDNLTRYQQRQACRVPWPADDPVFFPRPQAEAPAAR